MGELSSGEEMLSALERLKSAGFEELDGYSPYPVDGASELLELPKSSVRVFALAAGIFGAVGGYILQWWTNDANWPLNVGGRPPHAAPSFIPLTFETMELFAAFAAFLGLLYLLKYPKLNHPVHEVEGFKSVSVGGFWVSTTLKQKSRVEEATAVLRELHPKQISVVPEREK